MFLDSISIPEREFGETENVER